MTFDEFEQFAHRLADAAACATLPFFRAGLAVEDKGGERFDPVTAADRAAEAAMRALITATFPDHDILGEELGEKASGSIYRWVLDPIDGTRSFIAGLPLWTTIIGLEIDGRAMFGMVDQPYVGDRFWGHHGGARWRNRHEEGPLATRPCSGLSEATMMTTAPALLAGPSREAYDRIEREVRLVRYSADAYAYCMVAAGTVDLVVERDLQRYDIAGLVPIVEGAGGFVTSWSGGPVGEDGSVVAAGDRAVHRAALEMLRV